MKKRTLSPLTYTSILVILVAAGLATSCASCTEDSTEFPLIDVGDEDVASIHHDAALADVPVADQAPQTWTVMVGPDAPRAIGWTGDDIVKYLTGMNLTVELVEGTGTQACRPGEGIVVLVGDGLDGAGLQTVAPTDQTFRYSETRCGDAAAGTAPGTLIELIGGGLLGRQYAAYEWLHAQGVRFFHPEEEYVPRSYNWTSDAAEREHTPAFRFRSASLHLTHPLELGDVFELKKQEYAEEARRYIDWQVKNLASVGHTGAPGVEGLGVGDLSEYGIERGLPRQGGFALHNQQQGRPGVVDPDDPRSDEEQIAAAIDAQMGDDPELYPLLFGFTFNPSEFTEIDDQDAVRQLTFIADYFAEHYPDTIITVINHGTAGPPTAHYNVRYYDLPQFAPPNLGVRVHTLMFYDLFRPAPVYGNTNFNYLYDFMEQEHQIRRLWYYPEAAWWLTFDIPLPLYLPITIEARNRDIQGIKHMLEGKLDGHRVFGSGHEWGYWQNEYCPFRMSVDTNYSHLDCLADITSPMGEAAGEVMAVLERTIEFQERDFIYGDILAYLVGTDPETEIAASVGIVFHPLPPSPKAILRWSIDEVESWEANIGPALREMDDDYGELFARLQAVRALVPDDGQSWFGEIRDGILATGLRARHARQVYGAIVSLRRFQLTSDGTAEVEARRLLENAQTTTTRVIQVVRQREEGYRYQPIARSIAGGPDGTEDDNWTVYNYRYLNRTHHGYYYTRVDSLAQEAFEGASQAVEIPNVVLGPHEALQVTLSEEFLSDPEVDFGDERVETDFVLQHAYDAPGIYEVSITATLDEEPFDYATRVAVVTDRLTTGFTGRITTPENTAVINPALPSIAFGFIDEDTIAIGFGADEEASVRPGNWGQVLSAATDGYMQTVPARVSVPVVNRAQAEVMTSLVVEGAVFTLDERDGGELHLTGQLSTEAVVQAIVSIGGFDELGARRLVASTLGYTPDTLPAFVPFEASFDVE